MNGGKIHTQYLHIFNLGDLLNYNNFCEIIQFFYPKELKITSIKQNLYYSIIKNPSIIHIPDITFIQIVGCTFMEEIVNTNDLIGFIFDQKSIGQRKINHIMCYGQDFLANYLKVIFRLYILYIINN
jgi:hypothetical protein